MLITEIIGIANFKVQRKALVHYTLLVYDFEFTTPCWPATSNLLHCVQFIYFFGGGGQGPQYINDVCIFLNRFVSIAYGHYHAIKHIIIICYSAWLK